VVFDEVDGSEKFPDFLTFLGVAVLRMASTLFQVGW
jgi:hypothetical protein